VHAHLFKYVIVIEDIVYCFASAVCTYKKIISLLTHITDCFPLFAAAKLTREVMSVLVFHFACVCIRKAGRQREHFPD
jgi:hypothetical protein